MFNKIFLNFSGLIQLFVVFFSNSPTVLSKVLHFFEPKFRTMSKTLEFFAKRSLAMVTVYHLFKICNALIFLIIIFGISTGTLKSMNSSLRISYNIFHCLLQYYKTKITTVNVYNFLTPYLHHIQKMSRAQN